jgi:hypothetical protein
MIFPVLLHRCAGKAERHDEEKEPHNLEPQLVGRARERPRSGADCAHQRPQRTVASGLLAGNSGRRSELSQGRNFIHGLDFNSLRRYNDATRGCGDPFRGRRHLRYSGWQIVPGGPVDQQLKQLMKELGDAINESLSDSEQISEVVSRIKEGGYDIFLVLEATIGVSKQGEKSPDKTSLVTTLSTNPEFKINDQDLKFLRSLRIKIDEEKQDKDKIEKDKHDKDS